jgi:hypothetical protein
MLIDPSLNAKENTLRKLALAAVMIVGGSTAAFAQFGPGSPDGPYPPPPPPGYDRGPPPPPGYGPPPRRRCYIEDTPRGPRRICRPFPPPPPPRY